MVNAASSLQAALGDILRSPAPSSSTYLRPPSINRPLPGRPRSTSLPLITDLPVELPGSILQENQGFPPDVVPETTSIGRPKSQNVRRSTLPAAYDFEDDEDLSSLLKLFPELTLYTKSGANFGNPHNEMRSVRSGNALSSDTAPKPSPLKIHQNMSLPSADTASLLKGGGSTNRSARTRAGTCKTLQTSLPILEGQTCDNEHHERRRIEVSTVCFYDLVCLFVKYDALHNETVSELFVFPPFPL
jgi:hypothetical protein